MGFKKESELVTRKKGVYPEPSKLKRTTPLGNSRHPENLEQDNSTTEDIFPFVGVGGTDDAYQETGSLSEEYL